MKNSISPCLEWTVFKTTLPIVNIGSDANSRRKRKAFRLIVNKESVYVEASFLLKQTLVEGKQ